MKKIRPKQGNGAWGKGLDYLLEDSWAGLDKLVANSSKNKHDSRLITVLFPLATKALEDGIELMRLAFYKEQHAHGFFQWLRDVEPIIKFEESCRNEHDKVAFIDTVVQFLRELTLEDVSAAPQAPKPRNISAKNTEFSGTIVWQRKGKIHGKVQLVSKRADFDNFEKGNILLARETNANFLALMLKAKAIITDKGGLLCHAAIVSRELKIPCVVGTEIATRVLQDGQIVEIDTSSGSIKVL